MKHTLKAFQAYFSPFILILLLSALPSKPVQAGFVMEPGPRPGELTLIKVKNHTDSLPFSERKQIEHEQISEFVDRVDTFKGYLLVGPIRSKVIREVKEHFSKNQSLTTTQVDQILYGILVGAANSATSLVKIGGVVYGVAWAANQLELITPNFLESVIKITTGLFSANLFNPWRDPMNAAIDKWAFKVKNTVAFLLSPWAEGQYNKTWQDNRTILSNTADTGRKIIHMASVSLQDWLTGVSTDFDHIPNHQKKEFLLKRLSTTLSLFKFRFPEVASCTVGLDVEVKDRLEMYKDILNAAFRKDLLEHLRKKEEHFKSKAAANLDHHSRQVDDFDEKYYQELINTWFPAIESQTEEIDEEKALIFQEIGTKAAPYPSYQNP